MVHLSLIRYLSVFSKTIMLVITASHVTITENSTTTGIHVINIVLVPIAKATIPTFAVCAMAAAPTVPAYCQGPVVGRRMAGAKDAYRAGCDTGLDRERKPGKAREARSGNPSLDGDVLEAEIYLKQRDDVIFPSQGYENATTASSAHWVPFPC
jgi:hypothetical protein